jgi:hypothetical protein
MDSDLAPEVLGLQCKELLAQTECVVLQLAALDRDQAPRQAQVGVLPGGPQQARELMAQGSEIVILAEEVA